jgi:putative pyruvate formate lyase activating enzyme
MWRLSRPDTASALDDAGVRKSLPRYVDVVKNEKYAKFLLAASIETGFSHKETTERLRELHGDFLEKYNRFEAISDGGQCSKPLKVKRSFLDLKIELGKRIMVSCHFCERRCGSNRLTGGKGECKVGNDFSVSSCFPHLGEEPELVPSGTVFTLGCTIRCIHCQNWEISQWQERGTTVDPTGMALLVEKLKEQGCRNINMVGGDPTPNCWLWIKTMSQVESNIATVWNSNSYYSRETADLLAGFIDLYLLDFKFGNDSCATEVSGAPDYWEASTRNHLMANRHGELIIRVLVLPEHNECCTKPILKWIAGNLGPWTRVNLMFQYRPEWRARERKELRRRLNSEEIEEAQEIARKAGLKNLVRG